MCSLSRSTRVSRPPPGFNPLARHWILRSLSNNGFKRSSTSAILVLLIVPVVDRDSSGYTTKFGNTILNITYCTMFRYGLLDGCVNSDIHTWENDVSSSWSRKLRDSWFWADQLSHRWADQLSHRWADQLSHRWADQLQGTSIAIALQILTDAYMYM